MTKKEKIIATAYTGIMFIDGSELGDLYKYEEEKLGHGVIDVMHADKDFMTKVKDAVKDDFLAMICDESKNNNHKIEIRKLLPNNQSKVEGIESWGGEMFIPIYNLYVDERRIGQYINEYDAVREAFRQKDVDTISVEYENNPNSFSSFLDCEGDEFHEESREINLDELFDDIIEYADKDALNRLVEKAQRKLN